jgi:hypothetical protein
MYTTPTGFVERGKDFGSSYIDFLKAPKIAVLFGEQTESLNSGEIWYYFEQQVHYPITQIGTEYFRSVDLRKYDILIVPEGDYRLFDEGTVDSISDWVSAGGKLILVGNAVSTFADKKGFALKVYASDAAKADAEKKAKEAREKDALIRYEDAERKQLSDYITGAIYKVSMDRSHPLGYGMRDGYFTLKTDRVHFAYLESGWNVGVLKNGKPVQGFAGANMSSKLSNSLIFGVEDKGRGKVVYMVDNPLFRCFWENGKMLFSNAVFMVGNN